MSQPGNRLSPLAHRVCGRLALVLIVLCATATPPSQAEEEAKKRPGRAPIPGIRWQDDFEVGMKLAARRGQPILLALNALENEGANIRLATDYYRSKAWGEATRGYVCFVCNPNDHDGPDGRCTRYPGTTTASRIAALNYVLKRFGADQISPQHIILNPDGSLGFRKEYYTGVVGPRLFEHYLAKIAPSIALAQASVMRAAKIKTLRGTETSELGATATAWIKSGDPYAVGGVVSGYEDEVDDARRALLIAALAKTPKDYAEALWYSAAEFVPYPDDDPSATKGWVAAMLSAHRELGAWSAALAVARTNDKVLRDELMKIWSGSDAASIDSLPENERARAFEALALAKDARGAPEHAKPYLAAGGTWKSRIERALGHATKPVAGSDGSDDPLADALGSGDARALIALARTASKAAIRQHQHVLQKHLSRTTHDPLRRTLAIALLRAGVLGPKNEVTAELNHALADPIETGDTKRALRTILKNVDVDGDTATWQAALTAHAATLRSGGAK